MRELTPASILEMGKVATDSVWLVLLEIDIGTETLYLVGNNEDILWNSITWTAFPFQIETLAEAGKGEVNEVAIKVSNVTTEIQQKLELADGASKAPVTLRVINTESTVDGQSELEMSYVLKSSSWDEKNINFKLTGGNCLTRRTPPSRYLKNFCRFEFLDIRCGLASSAFTTCNKTHANCVERGNEQRFGGVKWMPKL
jgi:phage-related protein